MAIDDRYVKNLPDIYRDILETYPQFNSTRIAGDGLAYASLYSALTDDKKGHTLGQIQKACENMAEVGLMVIKHDIFACPTPKGEELISAITGRSAPPVSDVPPIEAPP
ncbi:MAG: hypothetical protein OXU79_12080 [Gemmatimonadota bacterium]|nr:hypothetical protein [Gemmatimonadota bacterium]